MTWSDLQPSLIFNALVIEESKTFYVHCYPPQRVELKQLSCLIKLNKMLESEAVHNGT